MNRHGELRRAARDVKNTDSFVTSDRQDLLGAGVPQYVLQALLELLERCRGITDVFTDI